MKTVDPILEEKSFGGKVVVFGGDFHQILPVVVMKILLAMFSFMVICEINGLKN